MNSGPPLAEQHATPSSPTSPVAPPQPSFQCPVVEDDDEDGLTLSQLCERWRQHEFLDSQENSVEFRGRESSCEGESTEDEDEVELRGGLEALTWPPELLHT